MKATMERIVVSTYTKLYGFSLQAGFCGKNEWKEERFWNYSWEIFEAKTPLKIWQMTS